MNKEKENFEIPEAIREQITNYSLYRALIFGIISLFLVTIRVIEVGYSHSFFFQVLMTLLIIGIFFFRKKISSIIKISMVLLAIMAIAYLGLFRFGFVSSGKMLFILISVASMFVFPIRRALVFSIILFSVYFLFAYLWIAGWIKYDFDVAVYSLKWNSWLIDGLHLVIVTAIIMIIIRKYTRFLVASNNELKFKNEEIQRKESNYHEIFNATTDAIFIHRAIDGSVADVNDTVLKMYGYEREDIESLEFKEICSGIYPYTESEAIKKIDRTLKEGSQTFKWHARKKNGELFWVEVVLSVTTIGGQDRVLAVIRNIDERISTEKAMKREQQFSANLLDLLPGIFYLYEFSEIPRLIRWNKYYEMLLGYSHEELNAMEIFNFFKPEKVPHIAMALKELNEKGESVTEIGVVDTTGKEIPFLFISRKFEEDGKVYFFGFGIDISDRKKAEQELEKYQKQLEILVHDRTEELKLANTELTANNKEIRDQQEQLKTTLNDLKQAQRRLIQSEKMASIGVLTAGVAHEINNPLNFIKSGIYSINELLKKELDENAMVTLHKVMDHMQIGIQRTSEIVSGLNRFSRSGEQKSKQDCNLHQIIDNCLLILNHESKDKCEIIKKYSEAPLIISGIEGELHQVFMNILLNSIQSIPKKGSITITTEIGNKKAIVKIEDTGKGISADILEKIFDPFFTTKPPGKGTGLGLSIVYEIVTRHGGDIQYTSERGNGTAVIIDFPLT